jgi:hypothetical protein
MRSPKIKAYLGALYGETDQAIINNYRLEFNFTFHEPIYWKYA